MIVINQIVSICSQNNHFSYVSHQGFLCELFDNYKFITECSFSFYAGRNINITLYSDLDSTMYSYYSDIILNTYKYVHTVVQFFYLQLECFLFLFVLILLANRDFVPKRFIVSSSNYLE